MKNIIPVLRQRITHARRALFPKRSESKGETPTRSGWVPLPEAPQFRRRSTDARPWGEVRPTGSIAPGVRSKTPSRIP